MPAHRRTTKTEKPPSPEMTFGSLFSGVGGFDVGLERAGWKPAWQVEFDKHCMNVLQKHWPDVPLFSDITEVSSEQLLAAGGGESPDLIVGGFPCQDISLAGKRRGLAGTRSGLWWEFHRILEDLRPEYAIIENVQGLLSSNGGRDLGAILGALGELGYGYAYRVLDSRFFGVAQRRRRLFIVASAHHHGRPAEVLLEPEGVRRHLDQSRTTWSPAARAAAVRALQAGDGARPDGVSPADPGPLYRLYPHGGQGADLVAREVEDDIHPTLVANAGQYSGDRGVMVTSYRKSKRAQTKDDYETWVEAEETNTLNLFDAGDTRSTQIVVGYPDPAGPITQRIGKGVNSTVDDGAVVSDGVDVRRLTPVECERLQGFPDDWTAVGANGKPISDTQRYRQMGNAVTVPVITWIGGRLHALHEAE